MAPKMCSWSPNMPTCCKSARRNMQNYRLLEAVGQAKKPVLLKRGPSATIEELLLAAEYILNEGNPNVMLCERGIRTFESHTRFTLPLATVPYLHHKTHLPIVVDPSHGTGHTYLVPDMAVASIAAGADGLILEVHPDPERPFPTAINRSIFRSSWRPSPAAGRWPRQSEKKCSKQLRVGSAYLPARGATADKNVCPTSFAIFAPPLAHERLQLPLFWLWQPGDEAFSFVVVADFAAAAPRAERRFTEGGANSRDHSLTARIPGNETPTL